MTAPGIPATVLLERLAFLIQTAKLELGGNNTAGAERSVDEALSMLTQLRKAMP